MNLVRPRVPLPTGIPDSISALEKSGIRRSTDVHLDAPGRHSDGVFILARLTRERGATYRKAGLSATHFSASDGFLYWGAGGGATAPLTVPHM